MRRLLAPGRGLRPPGPLAAPSRPSPAAAGAGGGRGAARGGWGRSSLPGAVYPGCLHPSRPHHPCRKLSPGKIVCRVFARGRRGCSAWGEKGEETAPDRAAGFGGESWQERGVQAEPRPGCKCTPGPPGTTALKPGSGRKKRYSPKRTPGHRGVLGGEGGRIFRSERRSPGLAVTREKKRLGSAPPLRRAGIEISRDSQLGVLFSSPTSPTPNSFSFSPLPPNGRDAKGAREGEKERGSRASAPAAEPGWGGRGRAGAGTALGSPLPLRRGGHGHGGTPA